MNCLFVVQMKFILECACEAEEHSAICLFVALSCLQYCLLDIGCACEQEGYPDSCLFVVLLTFVVYSFEIRADE